MPKTEKPLFKCGHPKSAENTYLISSGYSYCRECHRIDSRHRWRSNHPLKPKVAKVEITCDWCGKITQKPKSQADRFTHHFCNRSCFLRFQCSLDCQKWRYGKEYPSPDEITCPEDFRGNFQRSIGILRLKHQGLSLTEIGERYGTSKQNIACILDSLIKALDRSSRNNSDTGESEKR